MNKLLSSIITAAQVKPIKPIIIGKIKSAYGIRGQLKVVSFTKETANIFTYQPWFVKKNQWQQIKLESWKLYNKNLIISIINIKNREAAILLTNCEIVIETAQLPELEKGQYYWKDLIGCQVITVNGYNMGKVVNLIETGSNEVLVVKSNPKDAFGIRERLIPFLDIQVIKNVDIMAKFIEVIWDPKF
ncbi:Ribosome maturation factor RimM [secondary endosymbiont of Trabutina mannipara]|uniref:Ribosome maturation factor RimM n=1 Tax=secondary endosymbiont of Trabutina mannipara TaxID=1835721 RepID=A0A1C3L3Z7_9ENTR|nr:ribosome maturation factor RimM [secondary endosymbiont of Trabutina mannipara]SBT82010.1 Ribosome maturation factor RimM [secondary endosymbiont of Trabutina mannipara]